MQHHNWWETLLHQRFADQELSVRNLCFPGDEPFERIRSKNFGEPDSHLTHSKASVVLYFFGFNESFDGKHGIDTFAADMKELVRHTRQQNYSGKGASRVVLVSPIAFENTGDPNLPDGTEQNNNLEIYMAALADVAKESGAGFVDLFHPTLELFKQSDGRLTLNGAHLNDDGYRELAPILMRGLFGGGDVSFDRQLKMAIDDKNFHWWHRYRAVNGFSIYGDRGKAGSDGTYNNTDVMERERAILDQMAANRDQRIWAIAQGKTVSKQVDDSNTLPFINTKTNVGGDNDPNRKKGKLGSLDYLTAEKQQKLFKLAPGYEINLVASEEQFPELANPVALNFDNKGRLWVATMASYPHWKPKTPMDDKLLIFEDHDNDSRADECKVFAGGLHQPTGFEIGRGGVYIAQQPDILFVQDLDGDDKADTRVRQLVGFCSADSHHGISAFEWGPGGNLYFEEGTFKFSQVESPYGLTRLHEAGVWRYDPRTEKFGVHVSLAFANPWGHVFDRWGQNFIGDASPGNSYWAAPISGFVEHPLKHPGGAQGRRVAQSTGNDPTYKFPTFYPKRIRPLAGCAMVSSRHFPPEVQGNFLVTNCIGERTVLSHNVVEQGSGFVGEETPAIVSCEDGNFRPVDIQFAPDGSLYIVDWHNALIGHLQHNLRDPSRDHSHGRIWRVTYKGRPLVSPPKIDGQPIASLLDLLKLPEDRTRYRARRELADRPTSEVVKELDPWIASLDKSDELYEHNMLEALWMFQTHNVVRADILEQLLEATDHRARAAATRVLSFWLDRVPDVLELLHHGVIDSHPRVRLEAVRALSFFAKTPHRLHALEVALDALNSDTDHYLEYTLTETLRVLEATPTDQVARAHQHDHAAHDHDDDAPMEEGPKPTVFLNKSQRVVEFQLARLDNQRLLMVDRQTNDKKFALVFNAILTRAGMSPKHRQDAVSSLVELNKSDAVDVLLKALATIDGSSSQEKRTARQLSAMLLRQPAEVLDSRVKDLTKATESKNAALRSVGYASLVVAGQGEAAWTRANQKPEATLDWLRSVSLIPQPAVRARLRENVVSLLDGDHSANVRRAAVSTLASVPTAYEDNFQLLAPFVSKRQFRTAAVRSLLKIPQDARDTKVSRQLVDVLVKHAETTPAAKRTTDEFIDEMQLADQLLARIPVGDARSYRDRLREVTVRVVRIHTVEEEMRYDTPYFAVEAGRPVQIVLQNEDLMPHNLVITVNGALKEVAELGAVLGPKPGFQRKPYVPKSDKVLFATDMVQAGQQYRLTFTAPKQPGEYPYVCTFPRHWMRMYGVMVVVPDLDEWTQNPTKPKDPIGSNRSFVKSWAIEDFSSDLANGLPGRSPEIGHRLFTEATCALCHKTSDKGGSVGPALDQVFTRWKGDHSAVLREVLDPSHRIDAKYAVHIVITVSGKVVTGIVQAEDKTSISILANPESKEPTVIKRSDIDEMVKTSKSMMPKALLDRYTKDEILELLAFLESLNAASE